jgi:septal ring factor EnvC (AmiA/AmiB activator)
VQLFFEQIGLFIQQHIGLLWIIPAVAFSFFLFLQIFFAQKREERADMSQEVAQFNTGETQMTIQDTLPNATDRLGQLEKAIASVTNSLLAQQRAIEQFHKENSSYSGEINELKSRLRELYKEYDIVLSENYLLRAKVKKLQGKEGDEEHEDLHEVALEDIEAAAPPPPQPVKTDNPLSSKVDMKLYEDTRALNLTLLDDTSEIDIADLVPPNS